MRRCGHGLHHPPVRQQGHARLDVQHGLLPRQRRGRHRQSFRAGAKLVNLELATRHAGPRYFERAGKSTWIGVYKYPDGRTLGPFVSKPTKELGDITSDIWNASFTEVVKNGSGPAYLDWLGNLA